MKCSYCCSDIKERIYTFNLSDDNDNLYCVNKSCISNINNDVSIFDKLHKIKYFCQQCHRTLLYNNKLIFRNHNLVDSWLNLHEFGNDSYCYECENYVLTLKNYDICNICGIICKNNICGSHDTIFDNVNELHQTFIKNQNDEKCKYCHRYLMKCTMCKNSCYVCVFRDCGKSQLNGLKLEYYSYLCKKHSIRATNGWTNEITSNSNIVCEDCGTNKTCYKPNCNCLGLDSVSLCINCHDVDYAMYGLYCYSCS